MEFWERLVRLVLLGCLTAIGGYIIVNSISIAEENGMFQSTPLLSAIYDRIETQTAGTYLPVLSYAVSETDGMTEQELPEKLMEETFPLKRYLKEQRKQKKRVESSEEYALIVQAEAQAEEHKQPRSPQEPEKSAQTERKAVDISEMSYSELLNRYFSMDVTTTIDEERLNGNTLAAIDLTMEKNASQPQILIYHTHSQEAFADSVEGDDRTTILGVGDYLTDILTERYGYRVIHERGVFDLVDGVLDRNIAYDRAQERITEILEEYPSIQVVIDLHRDGVDGTKFVTKYHGKPAARLMLIVGMSRTADGQDIVYLPNNYIEENLSFALQTQVKAQTMYPDLMRNIYLMAYRFNMHLRPRSLLLEAGTQLNTVAEEKNAMEAFANVLDQVLKGE
ncbi:MAG: stage II sporulation protein P [Eubacteriales bacterium]|nr:stage II sporulation protein P [Eubacteriales bacterium]